MTRTGIFTVLFALALGFSLPAMAAEDAAPAAKDAAPATKEAAPAAKDQPSGKTIATNPYVAKLDKRSKEIGAKLKPKELEHLFYIREGFGVLRAVYMVERDVGTAVKACARDNPALRDGIQKRFSDWTGAVDPVMKEKQDAIDTAINDQTYIKAKEIKDYLKLIEQAAEYANSNIDKEIVTTPEACNKLSSSMDKTQETVARLLGEIQIKPWPPLADAADDNKPVSTPN